MLSIISHLPIVSCMNKDVESLPGLLIVDDELDVRNVLKEALSGLTDDIVLVESGQEAIKVCLSRSFDLVISDMRMPGMDGAELLKTLSRDYPSMRRIILTGYSDLDQTLKAINEGRVNRYLTKPFSIESLVQEVTDELKLGQRERSEISRLRRAINLLSDESRDD